MTQTCDGNCSRCLDFSIPQPYGVELTSADGIMAKQMVIPQVGTIVPQHAHVYDHMTLLSYGKVRMWQGGAEMGDFEAPHAFNIPAGEKHSFQSLVAGTVMYCIHRIDRTGGIDVASEHQLAAAKFSGDDYQFKIEPGVTAEMKKTARGGVLSENADFSTYYSAKETRRCPGE